MGSGFASIRSYIALSTVSVSADAAGLGADLALLGAACLGMGFGACICSSR